MQAAPWPARADTMRPLPTSPVSSLMLLLVVLTRSLSHLRAFALTESALAGNSEGGSCVIHGEL